ncbi:MAG: Sulfotransferase, partial [uncultured Rubrobacteraceae bacterium]
ALREPKARHAGADAPHSRLSRRSRRREAVGGDPRVLLLRLDEAERHQERPFRRRLLGRRRRGLYQPGDQRPLDGAPHRRRRGRVRGPGRPGARARVRALARDGKGAL